MTFDSTKIEFMVESTNQALAGEYNISLDVTCNDVKWLGQTISTSFTLFVEKIDSNFSNSPPVFEDLDQTSQFILTKNTNSTGTPYEIKLGSVFDPDGDIYNIEFENYGNNFITLDEVSFTLNIESATETGVYTCNIRITDDNS